jgi:L-iditol 2-dehydrogenase
MTDNKVYVDQDGKETVQVNREDGLGADLIFTANPVANTQEQAVEVVGKRGVVNLFGGLPKTAKKIEILSNNIHYKEAYLTGSHGSTPHQHKKAPNITSLLNIYIRSTVCY